MLHDEIPLAVGNFQQNSFIVIIGERDVSARDKSELSAIAGCTTDDIDFELRAKSLDGQKV
jgi:hypothetical protein